VLVLVDGSESTVAATAVAATSGVAFSESVRRLSARVSGPPGGQLEARPVVLFNPDSRTANYLIPGLVAVLMQMVTSVLTAIAIVRERERGTLEQLLVTPVEPLGLMLGKVAPYLVVGFAELTGILSVMHFVFGVPIHGSLVFLYAMALVYVFALLSIGLYVSIGAQTQQQAQGTIQMFFLPSMFLSGYIFPLASLPWPLRMLGQVFPVTHFIEIMRGVVLRGAGPLDLWRSCLALIAISIALITASVRRFRKMSLV
jgi:ABC-2 type transport system permease protein